MIEIEPGLKEIDPAIDNNAIRKQTGIIL